MLTTEKEFQKHDRSNEWCSNCLIVDHHRLRKCPFPPLKDEAFLIRGTKVMRTLKNKETVTKSVIMDVLYDYGALVMY